MACWKNSHLKSRLRLTASPQAAAAVELMRQKMQDLGLDGVHLEPILVNRWVRGKEEAKIVNSESQGTVPLSICASGGGVGTPELGITAPVLEVKSFQNLSPVPAANVVGQITGAEFSEEIILLGGHLDSWDLGTGAHDDGAGCVQAVEALRLIK